MKTLSAENLASLKPGRGGQIRNKTPHITVISKIFIIKLPIKDIDGKDAHSLKEKTVSNDARESL